MTSVWDQVPGQKKVVAQLQRMASRPVHAYLFTGLPGVGKEAAAASFAAALLCAEGGCGTCHSCRLVASRHHPDLVEVARSGAAVTVDQARELIGTAHRMPMQSTRTVVILPDFHLVDEAAPALLKTIEEPPPTTVFVILADTVTPRLVTIASRCIVVAFGPLAAGEVSAELIKDGVAPDAAERLAAISGGRLDRARRAATDPAVVERDELWRSAPDQLDGEGAAIARLASALMESVEKALVPLTAQQDAELKDIAAASASGHPVPPKSEVTARHKREQRRVRTEELRYGLAAMASAYRERINGRLVGGADLELSRSVGAVELVNRAAAALERNPNEPLLLQALLVRLAGFA